MAGRLKSTGEREAPPRRSVRPKLFRYSVNQKIRRAARWIMGATTLRADEQAIDWRTVAPRKILLVRATFRMGDSILATPAVAVLRKRFPNARIDFVGPPVASSLFHDLPVERHFSIVRYFPRSSWSYLVLLVRLWRERYDVAIDLSGAKSALGAFIVGCSRARFRIGVRGKWDRCFNVRIDRPSEKNRYRLLPAFLNSLGLDAAEALPAVPLSRAERQASRERMAELVRYRGAPTVGIFVGGRKTWAKRWPVEKFCRLAAALDEHGINVVGFFGPDETPVIGYFRDALRPVIPLFCDASAREFAGFISCCDLFVACDSGPMHLACALGTRTIAIFQHRNFDRWAPSPAHARVLYDARGCSAEAVFGACLAELGENVAADKAEDIVSGSAEVAATARRLELSRTRRRLGLFTRCGEALFVAAVVAYAFLFPPSALFEGSWADALTDACGLLSLVAGAFVRIWAVSHIGPWTGPGRLKAPTWPLSGPYSIVRFPVAAANFLIGLGMILILDAFPFIPLLLLLAALQHRFAAPAEEAFFEARFGADFTNYRDSVPAYAPEVLPRLNAFSWGGHFIPKELSAMSAMVAGTLVLEWLKSPPHREWVGHVLHLLSH